MDSLQGLAYQQGMEAGAVACPYPRGHPLAGWWRAGQDARPAPLLALSTQQVRMLRGLVRAELANRRRRYPREAARMAEKTGERWDPERFQQGHARGNAAWQGILVALGGQG